MVEPAQSDSGVDSAPPGTGPGPGDDGRGRPVRSGWWPPTGTPPGTTTVINETTVEILDREVGPDAPRREHLFAAASKKGVPLRTILTVDTVVIATWVLYRLIGRLREVILWILIAAFIALVLNPAVHFLERHRVRRGAAIGLVFAGAAIVFAGLLGLFGYPLVNSLTHVAKSLPTMVNQVQKGHGWLAHTLQRFRLLSSGAEERPEAGDGGEEPEQAGARVRGRVWPVRPSRPCSRSSPSPSSPCSCCSRRRGSGAGCSDRCRRTAAGSSRTSPPGVP